MRSEMTIKYEWKINRIVTKKDSEEIAEIFWSKKGVDAEGHEGVFEGVIHAGQVELKEDAKYVPLNKLKEKDVLEWVKNSVSYEDHVDRVIGHQIQQQINAANETPLPWAKPAKTTK